MLVLVLALDIGYLYWILSAVAVAVAVAVVVTKTCSTVADSSRRSAFYLCFRDLALRSVRDIVIENVPFCHKAIPRVPYKWYIEYYDTYSYGTVSVTIIFHYYFSFLTPTPQEKREELFRKPCEGPRWCAQISLTKYTHPDRQDIKKQQLPHSLNY